MEPLLALIAVICTVGGGNAYMSAKQYRALVDMKKDCIAAHVNCAKKNSISWRKEPTPKATGKFYDRCVD